MNKEINIFFAADDRYLPYLTVAITSISESSNEKYFYNINILTSSFSDKSLEKVKAAVKPNIKINVFNIEEKIKELREALSLRLRDYYSESIYYRLFIPSLFPNIDKAIYLDSDLIVCTDLAKLFFTDLEDNLIGAVTDETVMSHPIFCDYVKHQIGISDESEYINSGVLLMNLHAMRAENTERIFTELLREYNFDTVAPDQDYINFLCKGRILYLDKGWNKHAITAPGTEKGEIYIMHYNMFNKPWHYKNVPNEEFFWNTAEKTQFYISLLLERENYSDIKQRNDKKAALYLLCHAEKICNSGISIAETEEKCI